MRKRLKKTMAEKTAEDFFPVEPRDLQYAIEKPAKQVDFSSLTKIEKEGEKTEKKEKKTRKKPSREKRPAQKKRQQEKRQRRQ